MKKVKDILIIVFYSALVAMCSAVVVEKISNTINFTRTVNAIEYNNELSEILIELLEMEDGK